MDKIWLKSYPKGVPETIDVNEFASVREVFEQACANFTTRRAFSCMGKAIKSAREIGLSMASKQSAAGDQFSGWQGSKSSARAPSSVLFS